MENIDPVTAYLWVAVFGACVGSFITMASYRLPLGMDIVFKPSHCPSCSARLGFFDLFPIFTWIFSGRKCRHCAAPVPLRYPLTELVSALVFVGIFAMYGATAECAVLMLIATCILILIVTDFEHCIIPDQVQVGMLLSVIALLWVREAPVDNAIYGMLAGAGTGLGLRYGFLAVKKIEALGWGDVKLLPIIGLAVGLKPFVLVLILSGLLGIVTGTIWKALGRGPEFPFGPALAVSMFVLLLFSAELSSIAYLREFFL